MAATPTSILARAAALDGMSGKTPTIGKAEDKFRNYVDSARHAVVTQHYRMMRQNQTLAHVEKMERKYMTFDRTEMTIWEAFERLRGYVDSSDPDTELPNLEHMLQTAEAIRAAGHPDWFQLVGLLHDMGKIMYLWGEAEDGQVGTAEGPQWGLGGDTWVVGCRIPDTVVFPEFNAGNPDMQHPVFSTEYGMYKPNCGLAELKFAWGHDEYLYQMLKFNACTLPDEGMAMIRYHSCYPWHSAGEYEHLMAPGDHELLAWVRRFNVYDLYTKANERPNVEELWPYYQSLIDKYCPGRLRW